MKIEDAIKMVKRPALNRLPSEDTEAREIILAALEKQMPKETIRKERTLDGGATTYWHICPTCKNRGLLDKWHRQLRHCPHCGQALKWGE